MEKLLCMTSKSSVCSLPGLSFKSFWCMFGGILIGKSFSWLRGKIINWSHLIELISPLMKGQGLCGYFSGLWCLEANDKMTHFPRSLNNEPAAAQPSLQLLSISVQSLNKLDLLKTRLPLYTRILSFVTIVWYWGETHGLAAAEDEIRLLLTARVSVNQTFIIRAAPTVIRVAGSAVL